MQHTQRRNAHDIVSAHEKMNRETLGGLRKKDYLCRRKMSFEE